MDWIVDTSAWSRRERPEVARQIEELLGDDGVLVLSPAVELELLREPQGPEIAQERAELEQMMEVLAPDPTTFSIAADVMECLALVEPDAHRTKSVTDLITAALADQHGCGIIHLNGDFDDIREHGGLTYDTFRITLDGDGGKGAVHPVAHTQRELKKELAQLLHRLPVEEAEAFLDEVVDDLRRRTGEADDG